MFISFSLSSDVSAFISDNSLLLLHQQQRITELESALASEKSQRELDQLHHRKGV